jgi:hypothetical protein
MRNETRCTIVIETIRRAQISKCSRLICTTDIFPCPALFRRWNYRSEGAAIDLNARGSSVERRLLRDAATDGDAPRSIA